MKYITFSALLMLLTSSANAQLISEFQPNPNGIDPTNQTIEISGTPGDSFTDWTFLTIEAEGSNTGVIDRATTFSGTFDANGIFTIDVPDLENPAFTAILASGFTAAQGDDVDTDDDGAIDSGLFTVLDSLGVQDSGSAGSGDTFFTTTILAVPASTNEAPLVFRGPNGDWFQAFDGMDGLVSIYDIDGNLQDLATFELDAMVTLAEVASFGALNPGTGDGGGDPVLKGDVNLDGAITFLDINPFIVLLSSNGFQDEADCDCDGDLDFLDIQPFIDKLAGQ